MIAGAKVMTFFETPKYFAVFFMRMMDLFVAWHLFPVFDVCAKGSIPSLLMIVFGVVPKENANFAYK